MTIFGLPLNLRYNLRSTAETIQLSFGVFPFMSSVLSPVIDNLSDVKFDKSPSFLVFYLV